MHRVAISIVSHGHGSLLSPLLSDLAKQDIARDLVVLLTENIPDINYKKPLEDVLNVRVVKNPAPLGFGANHNAALKNFDAGTYIILNPDVRIPNADAIRRLVEHSECNGGLSAPQIVNSHGFREDSVRENLSPLQIIRRIFGSKPRDITNTTSELGDPFFWLAGMFLVIGRKEYEALNGFDRRFFLYCEDYDLSARAYLAGKKISVKSDIPVVHDAQRASRRSYKYLKWHMASLLLVWTSKVFWKIVYNELRR